MGEELAIPGEDRPPVDKALAMLLRMDGEDEKGLYLYDQENITIPQIRFLKRLRETMNVHESAKEVFGKSKIKRIKNDPVRYAYIFLAHRGYGKENSKFWAAQEGMTDVWAIREMKLLYEDIDNPDKKFGMLKEIMKMIGMLDEKKSVIQNIQNVDKQQNVYGASTRDEKIEDIQREITEEEARILLKKGVNYIQTTKKPKFDKTKLFREHSDFDEGESDG